MTKKKSESTPVPVKEMTEDEKKVKEIQDKFAKEIMAIPNSLVDPIMSFALKATKEGREPLKPKAELSEKAKKVQELLKQSDFQCQNRNVAKLMSIILDETVVGRGSDGEENIIPGAVFVPLKEGSAYPMGKPVLHLTVATGLIIDIFDTGNNFSLSDKASWRYATDDEVLEYFSRVKLAKISKGYYQRFLDYTARYYPACGNDGYPCVRR